MAPEMISGKFYDTQVDCWSLGVLLYYLMCGHMPFPAESQEELFAKINSGKFHYNHKAFELVSDECKDLINGLLVKDAKKRLTAAQSLAHKWFEKFHEDREVPEDIDRLDLDALKRM
jgi:serine/threonine protein kinase